MRVRVSVQSIRRGGYRMHGLYWLGEGCVPRFAAGRVSQHARIVIERVRGPMVTKVGNP